MTRIILHSALQRARRRLHEAARQIRGGPHRVHYFHQADDAYSDLAAQAIPSLQERYDIAITPHLVTADDGPNLPEPKLWAQLALHDAASIAPHYGLIFPRNARAPSSEATSSAQQKLSEAIGSGTSAFAEAALEVGGWLWANDPSRNDSARTSEATYQELAKGNALRATLGHYSSGTFYYAGEWYWGVDRLYHLEKRLAELGADRCAPTSPRFDRPAVEITAVPRGSEMRLEVFPSLRSPYSAIGFEPTLAMAQATGVPLEVRPVLPMVMRGVPATFRKMVYIMRDSSREAAEHKMPFGKMLDPIGEPTRRAFSLWPWAVEQGRGNEYIATFLRAAFAQGIDTSIEAGLRTVVEAAGLSWSEAKAEIGNPRYEEILENNRLVLMDEMGVWGVPSYRLRGPVGEPDLIAWGQDRLWLVSREIQRRGNS